MVRCDANNRSLQYSFYQLKIIVRCCCWKNYILNITYCTFFNYSFIFLSVRMINIFHLSLIFPPKIRIKTMNKLEFLKITSLGLYTIIIVLFDEYFRHSSALVQFLNTNQISKISLL